VEIQPVGQEAVRPGRPVHLGLVRPGLVRRGLAHLGLVRRGLAHLGLVRRGLVLLPLVVRPGLVLQVRLVRHEVRRLG
jgi:hypothetical protein